MAKKPKQSKQKTDPDDSLFDDCPICQAQKKALEEGREITTEELQAAFRKAKDQGATVSGEMFDSSFMNIVPSDSMSRKIAAKFSAKIPDNISDKIKISAEKVRGGYILFEMRPDWIDPTKPWTRSDIAKFSSNGSSPNWKLYWKRASGKWELYKEYGALRSALKAVDEDKNGCFWG